MIVVALLVAFAPDSRGQSKQPPAQNKQAVQPPAPDQRGTEEAPLAVKILPASDAEKQAEKQERDGKEKAETDRKLALETQRIADFTRLLAAFTAGLIAVAVAQAGLFLWQLRYMRRGMKDAENAARAANDAATAAKEQVEVAKAQIEVTKIGIFDLERAYLDAGPTEIVTSFVMDPPPASGFYQQGDPMEVVIKIGMKNTGRTRAAITRAYGEFSQMMLGEQPVYNPLIGTSYVTDLSMAANDKSDFPYSFTTRHIGDQFFFGFIEYKDIFKKTHTSRFCMRIMPALENGKSGKFQFAGNDRWRECD
jgi:hypothetical protein